MARSFSSPRFNSNVDIPRSRFAGKPGFGNPKQAFAYEPTRFNISGSAGQGVADAAGLSTLAENYKTLSEYNPDYDTLAAGLYAADQAEERSFLRAGGNILSNAERNKGMIEASKYAIDKAEGDANREKSAGLLQNGLKFALNAGMLALAASDIDTKHTIDELDDAMSLLRELRPVSFFYKEEYTSSPERMHYGFIAQEYQKVMPDQTYFDESIGKLCIDPVELIGVLVRAVQQLETKITRLEAKAALAGVK